MQNLNYSPSINIKRDKAREINYIVTPNAKNVYNKLISSYKAGVSVFSLIGSYGTGKSSFLWALEKSLTGKQSHFTHNGNLQSLSFRFLNIIGEYNSITNIFKKETETDAETLIDNIDYYYNSNFEENEVLVILIDEFGKLLEYAANNSPERELYEIQQFAEYIAAKERNIILITTLHQNFTAYANALKKEQKLEWDKVKGRFIEIPFNEPIEQLLYLASERLKSYNITIPDDLQFEFLTNTILKSRLLPDLASLNYDLAKNLFPLDLLSAGVLTLSLQRYGQNERSLFTFLDTFANNKFTEEYKNNLFGLNQVYNYLQYHFYAFLNSPHNPDTNKWASIRNAIDRVEANFEKDAYEAIEIIKIIGLINIFASQGGTADKNFLNTYSSFLLKTNKVDRILSDLEAYKIIRFANYRNQYILFEGTDINITEELQLAEAKLTRKTNIVEDLNRYFDFPYIPAKAVHYKYGSPRFFEIVFSEYPLERTPSDEIDGFINIIFNDALSEEEIINHTKKSNEAILYGWYKNSKQLIDKIFEIDKANHVIQQIDIHDRVARNELNKHKQNEINQLNALVSKDISGGNTYIKWYFAGEKIEIVNHKILNSSLSKIIEYVYYATPGFFNELANKTKLSTPIALARKNLFHHLLNYQHQEDLGFPKDKYPPEKAIYLSLIKNTGIHREAIRNKAQRVTYELGAPNTSSFKQLWELSEDFLESSKYRRRKLEDFSEVLATKPLKLKKGFIDFWLPLYLIINRDRFALFHKSTFIPDFSEDLLDLMHKSLAEFEIKAFKIEGVRLQLFNKYREVIAEEHAEIMTSEKFLETIRPFIVFYRELPEYAKRTNHLSKSALQFREAIANATDPEKTFFEDFPRSLGYRDIDIKNDESILKNYVVHLQDAIRQLRSCYPEFVNSIEDYLKYLLGYEDEEFPAYREKIQKQYKSIKVHLLPQRLRPFYKRLYSNIEERDAWLNSLLQVLMGKQMEKMHDEELPVMRDKFEFAFRELNNLVEIHKHKKAESSDEIVKFDITTKKGTKSKQFVLPVARIKEAKALQKKLEESLSKDQVINNAALVELIKKYFKE